MKTNIKMASKKSDWRDAHKELSNQIRSARDGGGAISGQPTGRAGPGNANRQQVMPSKQQLPELVPCKYCNRTFSSDRVQVHEKICVKIDKKKHKPFNSFKQRIRGTGAEQFLKKGKPPPPPKSLRNESNWRKQHQNFINSIRQARAMEEHVAAGGKRADLPPPEPLDTSNYIQCPHCGRKFNETAASRHIPACATMIHNKPKPKAPKK